MLVEIIDWLYEELRLTKINTSLPSQLNFECIFKKVTNFQTFYFFFFLGPLNKEF